MNKYLAIVLYAPLLSSHHALVLLQNTSMWAAQPPCQPASDRCYQHFMRRFLLRGNTSLNREKTGEERKLRVKLFALQSHTGSKLQEILDPSNSSVLSYLWLLASHSRSDVVLRCLGAISELPSTNPNKTVKSIRKGKTRIVFKKLFDFSFRSEKGSFMDIT